MARRISIEYRRLAYFEMSRGPIDLKNPWERCDHWSSIPRMCVTAARKESSALLMLDKHAAIDALALEWNRAQSSNDCGRNHQVFGRSVATVGKGSAHVVVETRGRSWVHVVQKPKQAWPRCFGKCFLQGNKRDILV